LIYGKYSLLDKNNPDVYAYTREWKGEKFLVVLNFSAKQANWHAGIDLSKAVQIIGNYPATNPQSQLRPYEAAVFRL
jgi:oligo-1,6-glucosidase